MTRLDGARSRHVARRQHRIAAGLIVLAGGMGILAATGTAPALAWMVGLLLTVAAFVVALRART